MSAIKVEGRTQVGAEGIDVGFQNLSYVVAVKAKGKKSDGPTMKTIVANASGICSAGRLLAIMGPSGAGKTSLLDVLAGRKALSTGCLSLGGGGSATPSEIQRYSAYVQQDDAIVATQTAQEALVMAALLTLPKSMGHPEKMGRVAAIMKTFQMESCADTLVGDPNGKVKGLSGGERKRCAVAMAAIREPKILFLDEPTSGLDAFKALTLVQVLKSMAQGAKSNVICTIHQPSSDIFAMFDDLMLLLAGNVVFHGDAGVAVPHFAQLGYTCPQYANPADFFFMHVLTTGSDTRTNELVTAWQATPDYAASVPKVQQFFTGDDKPKQSLSKTHGPQVMSSQWTQFRVLLLRGMNDIKRDPMRGKAQIGQSIAMGIILSLIWFQLGNDANSVQDRSGVLFFITTNGMMQNVMGVLTTFSGERGAVLREQENQMYRTLPYFVSRVAVDMPLKILGPSIFGTIAYWCVGFQPAADKYFTFLLVVILLAMAGNSMGLFLACIVPDVSVALAIAPIIILPLVMFSGFVLNPESVPIYLSWVEWISPTKYSFAALAQIEFSGLPIHCTEDQLQRIVTPEGKVIMHCGIPSGDAYLSKLNIQEVLTITNCAIMLSILWVLFTVLAYFGLVMITRKNQAKATAKSGKAPA